MLYPWWVLINNNKIVILCCVFFCRGDLCLEEFEMEEVKEKEDRYVNFSLFESTDVLFFLVVLNVKLITMMMIQNCRCLSG